MQDTFEKIDAAWVGIVHDNPQKPLCAWFKADIPQRDQLTAHLAANSRYRFYINGQSVLHGPCRGDMDTLYYDTFNIGPYLLKEQNEILVQVMSFPPAVMEQNITGGPIAVVPQVIGPRLLMWFDEEKFATGRYPWQGYKDEGTDFIYQGHIGYTAIGPFEKVKGGTGPLNGKVTWQEPHVYYMANAYGFGEHVPLQVRPRPIPLPYYKSIPFVREMAVPQAFKGFTFSYEQVVLPPHTHYCCTSDVGFLTCAQVTLHFKGGQGAVVKIGYAEGYSKNTGKQFYAKGVRDDDQNYDFEGYYDEVMIQGDGVYSPHMWRTFRFLRLEVITKDQPLTLLKPQITETGYPLAEKATFEGDAPWVKPVWDISVRTLSRCMHDAYMDCPYYEQLQYIFDARLEALYTYMLSGDGRLARKALHDFHTTLTPDGLLNSRAPTLKGNIIPGFSLEFIRMLEEYVLYTGDGEVLKRYRGTVDTILNYFDRRVTPTGLIACPGEWNFTDWAESWKNPKGFVSGEPDGLRETGVGATLCLLYALALQAGARIMERLSLHDLASEYQNRAESVSQSVLKQCWEPERGLLRETPGYEVFSQHAQVNAVLCGLFEGEDAKALLLQMFKDRKVDEATFAGRFALLRALEKAGLYEQYISSLLTPWQEALKLHLTTWPEDFAFQRSDCHAWSSLPLYEFLAKGLGVIPLKDGFSHIGIIPYTLGLTKAKGSIPTPQGTVKVYWEKQGQILVLEAETPSVPVTVAIGQKTFMYPQGGIIKLKATL